MAEQKDLAIEFEALLMNSKANLALRGKARTRFINQAKKLFEAALQATPSPTPDAQTQQATPPPPPQSTQRPDDSDRVARITSPAIERMRAGLPKGTMVMTASESARTDR